MTVAINGELPIYAASHHTECSKKSQEIDMFKFELVATVLLAVAAEILAVGTVFAS